MSLNDYQGDERNRDSGDREEYRRPNDRGRYSQRYPPRYESHDMDKYDLGYSRYTPRDVDRYESPNENSFTPRYNRYPPRDSYRYDARDSNPYRPKDINNYGTRNNNGYGTQQYRPKYGNDYRMRDSNRYNTRENTYMPSDVNRYDSRENTYSGRGPSRYGMRDMSYNFSRNNNRYDTSDFHSEDADNKYGRRQYDNYNDYNSRPSFSNSRYDGRRSGYTPERKHKNINEYKTDANEYADEPIPMRSDDQMVGGDSVFKSEENSFTRKSFNDKRNSSYQESSKRGRYESNKEDRNEAGLQRNWRGIKNAPSTILGLFNMSPYTTEDDIKELLTDTLPEITGYSVKVVMDFTTGLCRGFAFVDFDCLEDSMNAKKALDKKAIKGSALRTDYGKKTM